MPSILSNEILLYSTAFAAVSHINFLNPEAYKAERWALKEQAIRKINQALNDVDAVENDCTIGAILGMAFVAHLEVSIRNILSAYTFYTHFFFPGSILCLKI